MHRAGEIALAEIEHQEAWKPFTLADIITESYTCR